MKLNRLLDQLKKLKLDPDFVNDGLSELNTTQVKEKITEHMPIVCSDNKQFATVDKVEGNSIKVTKDQSGQHHYIPLDWVKMVDEKVHVDRPGDQAMREWSPTPTS